MVNTAEADDGPSCPGAAGARALDRIAHHGRLRSAMVALSCFALRSAPSGPALCRASSGALSGASGQIGPRQAWPEPVWRTLIGPTTVADARICAVGVARCCDLHMG